MRAPRSLRVAVVKTNPIWPFSRLNRLPYHLAIKAFVRQCRRQPEVRSVYLRHSLVGADWEPGLSDIDLTVLVADDLAPIEEHHFLTSFWRRFESLESRFPMLGEVDVMSARLLDSWTRFTMRGHDFGSWKLLAGTEAHCGRSAVGPERIARDSFNYALTTYTWHFLWRFFDPRRDHFLDLREQRRIAKKALRYVSYVGGRPARASQTPALGSKAEMAASIVKALEEAVLDSPLLQTGACGGASRAAATGQTRDPRFEAEKFARHGDAVQAVLEDGDTVYVVLRDGVDLARLAECAETMQRIYAFARAAPILLSRSPFEYLIRTWDPPRYASLAASRQVRFGEDILPRIAPPSRAAFGRAALDRVIGVLTFPRSRRLVCSSNRDWLREKGALSARASLAIKLYLEHGIPTPLADDLLREAKLHYPRHFASFEALVADGSGVDLATLRREWFFLLRSLADDVHAAILRAKEALP